MCSIFQLNSYYCECILNLMGLKVKIVRNHVDNIYISLKIKLIKDLFGVASYCKLADYIEPGYKVN